MRKKTPFHVSLFLCRDNGVGGGQIDVPEHNHVADSAATAYVRPHEIDISSGPGANTLAATLGHATRIGPVVRLELARNDDGSLVEVELSAKDSIIKIRLSQRRHRQRCIFQAAPRARFPDER